MRQGGPSLRLFPRRQKKPLLSLFTMRSICTMVRHKKSLQMVARTCREERYRSTLKGSRRCTSPYHPRTNWKVECLNGIMGTMLGKLLLNKPMKLWDLYLDQAVFTCRVRTYTTTKTSPFYLLYGRHPHFLGDVNIVLPSGVEAAPHDE